MYTKEDYLMEKSLMTKHERMIQDRFEKIIEILILYKQANNDKDVYLSEKSMNEAIKWFQTNIEEVSKLVSS
jgi:hypothetical protein